MISHFEEPTGFPSVSGRAGWRALLGLVVVIACFAWGLPAFASYRDTADLLLAGIDGADPTTAAALVVVAAFNLVTHSVSQTAALPGLRLVKAIWADWSTTAVTNLIPGGSAVAIGLIWAMYRSFGLARAAIARSIVVTGVWDVLVKLGTPLLALAWMSTQRPVDATLVRAAVIGGLLFTVALGLLVVLLSSAGTARRIGSVLDRLPVIGGGWGDRLENLRSETVLLLRRRGWALTFWTVIGHANLYVLLVVCLRLVGVEQSALGWAPILTAFAFGRLVTALPLTPGGLGIAEVGLIGALSAVAADSQPVAGAALVAAVLLFRFLSFALPLPLGLVGLLWWNVKRQSSADDDPAGEVLQTGPRKPEPT